MLIALLLVASGHKGEACRVTPDCDAPFVCIRRACVDKPAVEETPAPPPRYSEAPPSNAPRANVKWSAGDPVPAGAHVESRPIKALWVSGLIIDLSVWLLRGTAVGLACSDGGCTPAQVAGAFIPVIGAWITIPDTPNSADVAFLAVSGVIEAGGFAMLVLGAVLHHDVLVWDAGTAQLRVQPLATPYAEGVSLSAIF